MKEESQGWETTLGAEKPRKRRRKRRTKPNWLKRKPGRPKKKRWWPPRVGRPAYDQFRAYEAIEVAKAIRELVDRVRIHEKQPGSNGRPPFKKRIILKSLLFMEAIGKPIQEAPGFLAVWKHVLGIDEIPKPRTLYKYRALRNMTRIIMNLQWEAGVECWLKETVAAIDSTGNSLYKGTSWSKDRANPSKYKAYDKGHYLVGTRTLVIPVAKVTRGSWHDSPEFNPIVRAGVPGSNVSAVAADPAYVGIKNYEVGRELGVRMYIQPKDNAVFRPHPMNAYEAMVYFATRFADRFKSVYRWRTKAECANHAKKSRFGDVTRGSRDSRRNREHLQLTVHNLRFTLLDRYAA